MQWAPKNADAGTIWEISKIVERLSEFCIFNSLKNIGYIYCETFQMFENLCNSL